MSTFHQLINFIQALPWGTIGAYIGGSTLVATVLQIVKHKFSFAEAKGVVTFMLGLFSFAAAFADYIIGSASQNPTVLGRNTATLLGVAVIVHRFAVSPAYSKVVQGLTSLIKDAAAYRAQTTSTAAAEAPAAVETFSVV